MTKKGKKWCCGCNEWHPTGEVRAGKCQKQHNAYARKRYVESKDFRDRRRQRSSAYRRSVEPVPPEGREVLEEEFGGKCAYCGNPADTWDHIVPVSNGGTTIPSNIVPACSSCNSSKKTKDVVDWLREKGMVPNPALYDRMLIAEVWGH